MNFLIDVLNKKVYNKNNSMYITKERRDKMENKEMVSAGKISQYLIEIYIALGLLSGFIYTFVFSIINLYVEEIILKAVIAVLIQGIISIIVWKFSISSAFKNRTIIYNDVPTVMKNLIIFILVICVLTGIYNIASVNSKVDKAIDSNYNLKLKESMMSTIYSDKQMSEYNKEKERMIEDVKSKAKTYLVIFEVGLTGVYLVVLVIVKKEILKYVI